MNQAQAVPTVIHFHHLWLIWIIYYWGQLIHAALQVDSQARKAKIARVEVLKVTWIRLLYRLTFSTAIFLLVWDNPQLILKALSFFGHPLSGDEAEVLALPINNALALLYGLLTDSLLGYIPILKSQLPDLAD